MADLVFIVCRARSPSNIYISSMYMPTRAGTWSSTAAQANGAEA